MKRIHCLVAKEFLIQETSMTVLFSETVALIQKKLQQNTATEHIISELRTFGSIYITFGASSILKYYA